MKLRLSAVLLVLCTSLPTFARVISYAPYSDQPSESGVHLRTSRYFVLIEGADTDERKVVLYDSRGEEEPRVVYEPGMSIRTVALYEPPGAAPMLFVYGEYRSAFSADGGATWINVPIGASGQRLVVDTGGPYTGSLSREVRIGNRRFPFVVSSPSGLIYTIDAHGNLKTLPLTGGIFGQDLAGERFLLSHDYDRVAVVDLEGNYYRKLFDRLPGTITYTGGWITPGGEVFVEMQRARGRHLYHYARRQLTFVSGPDGLVQRDTPALDELRFFAIPTHDFRGAWMIRRAPGQPTTLMRYSSAHGLETMWSDPAGPEVEALIAGQSGQTVLVQVHVPRDVNVAVPFIDPALAVWRVGQPYPTAYDELYLNEEENKGFVHVDVDRLEEGEPFVFNSGSEIVSFPGEGPISPPIGGGSEVIQEWGVVRGSFKQRLLLPGAARMRGAFGSEWTTDVTIYNPLDEPQDVEVRFVSLNPAAQANARRTQTVRVAPRRITVINDVLHSLFMIANGGGSLIFEPAIGVNVFGRTYTRSGEGTYGYGMQAVDFFNSAGPRFPLFFSGAFPGPGFRTNVVLTDTSGRGTGAQLTTYGWSGVERTSALPSVTPAGGVLQFSPGSYRYQASALKLTATRGTMIPAVVVIDNLTNDATYFPPDIPATVPRSIPMIAHTDGPEGSIRSDLYLFNPTDEDRYVRLEAKMWDKPMRIIRGVYLEPFEARVVPDVMTNFFHGIFGVARLRYLSDGDDESGAGVRVTSRTYKTTPDGGTYGSLVPPLNNFQIAAPGDTLEILGISGGNAFRTNLALIELSQTNSNRHPEVRVRIFDDRLQELDSFVTTIESTYTKSFEDLFTLRGLTTPRAALIKVEVLTPGLVAAYTTLEDVATGDTTYLPANLGAKVR